MTSDSSHNSTSKEKSSSRKSGSETEIPGRNTKVLHGQPQKSLAETLPTWALIIITALGALLLLIVLFQSGLFKNLP